MPQHPRCRTHKETQRHKQIQHTHTQTPTNHATPTFGGELKLENELPDEAENELEVPVVDVLAAETGDLDLARTFDKLERGAWAE